MVLANNSTKAVKARNYQFLLGEEKERDALAKQKKQHIKQYNKLAYRNKGKKLMEAAAKKKSEGKK
jgi:hypothetical protein|eukprot:CAMPEP_0174283018 /NCGR_PEP_ID=MMETSP0809-20121228/3613_1 /TAXON_ID=73025 ORGANISM="Eutreptiella gymnastica-like, Strain CCMP1594" /NCGR_SAMPLE_ID=MMETSP0809 /ASSEMBLY_ACC=CAM_ASM_000658 /LENGTH=65 /DNA_ID=CAMNT_0015377619 /DNA_START=45 /DNA_END=242 /DNA_ORIENTATION=-